MYLFVPYTCLFRHVACPCNLTDPCGTTRPKTTTSCPLCGLCVLCTLQVPAPSRCMDPMVPDNQLRDITHTMAVLRPCCARDDGMVDFRHFHEGCVGECCVCMCVCVGVGKRWMRIGVSVCMCVSIGLTEHTDRGLARVGLTNTLASVCVCLCVCVYARMRVCASLFFPRVWLPSCIGARTGVAKGHELHKLAPLLSMCIRVCVDIYIYMWVCVCVCVYVCVCVCAQVTAARVRCVWR